MVSVRTGGVYIYIHIDKCTHEEMPVAWGTKALRSWHLWLSDSAYPYMYVKLRGVKLVGQSIIHVRQEIKRRQPPMHPSVDTRGRKRTGLLGLRVDVADDALQLLEGGRLVLPLVLQLQGPTLVWSDVCVVFKVWVRQTSKGGWASICT